MRKTFPLLFSGHDYHFKKYKQTKRKI